MAVARLLREIFTETHKPGLVLGGIDEGPDHHHGLSVCTHTHVLYVEEIQCVEIVPPGFLKQGLCTDAVGASMITSDRVRFMGQRCPYPPISLLRSLFPTRIIFVSSTFS